jgi:hypothetical protein
VASFSAPLSQVRAVLARMPDRRRYFRAGVRLSGRVLNEAQDEFDCRTEDVSPGGARLTATTPVKNGESIVIYLNELGRTPAHVVRVGPMTDRGGEFGVIFDISEYKREKIAERLCWALNRGLFEETEERRAPRKETAGGASVEVILEDGTTLPCEMADFSLLGCSLRTTQQRQRIGVWVQVGMTHGRVSRYFGDGFAVDFQPNARP